MPRDYPIVLIIWCLSWIAVEAAAQPNFRPTQTGQENSIEFLQDSDADGLYDARDGCPRVRYEPGFDVGTCGPMDLDPDNDPDPTCRARERIARLMMTDPNFVTNIAFVVVRNGAVYVADAFEYIGGGEFVHDPEGIHRLYRIGSTSKSVVAVAAKIMEERGELSFDDFVNDDDGTQVLVGGERTLRQLLSHDGAFALDAGSVHLFCYDGDLAAFWADPDDLVSPHYDSPTYGNLGGGFEYSAFNYSLAGAYLAIGPMRHSATSCRHGCSTRRACARRATTAPGR
jgi:CubicO group peptidase (beta-lactamase class C family)